MSASATIPTADQLAYRFYTKLAAALNNARATLDPNPHSNLDQLIRISPHQPVAQLTIFPVRLGDDIKLTLQQHSVSASASRPPWSLISLRASSSSTHPTALSSPASHRWASVPGMSVFSDVRARKVHFAGDGVRLIDFDWCGTNDQALYPSNINLNHLHP
jgi:hypothetical protein